jgi:hypothetical protein
MNFLIADTFTASFKRLAGLDQKAVKASVFDLQMDPVGNGLQLHRIDKSKDPNFWSARVNRDVRLIVHKSAWRKSPRLPPSISSSRNPLQASR